MSTLTSPSRRRADRHSRARSNVIPYFPRIRSSNTVETPSIRPTGETITRTRAPEVDRDWLTLEELEFQGREYVRHLERKADGSLITASDRAALIRRLVQFLREQDYRLCGPKELEDYFFHLRRKRERGQKPLSPASIASYYRNLKPVFTWCVEQGAISRNPLLKVAKPRDNTLPKDSLPPESVKALIEACATSLHPQRDEALILFMLDTGARNSEICSLGMKDINLKGEFATVLGKGNKKRQVYFSTYTAEKIQTYLDKSKRSKSDNGPLFISRAGDAFTKDGLCDVVKRLAATAGLSSEVTVHAFRRTFAVLWLRNGGHQFGLQVALGHTDLKTTQIYCKIAQSDVERQHRLANPVMSLLDPSRNENALELHSITARTD